MKLSPKDLAMASRVISLALLMAGIIWGSVLISSQVQRRGGPQWATPAILLCGVVLALWLGWRDLSLMLREFRRRGQ